MSLKKKSHTLLFAITLSHFSAVTDKQIVGQKNNEISAPFMYEIYNRDCKLEIESKDFKKIQSFDLSRHELEKVEVPHFNTFSNLFFFEEIENSKESKDNKKNDQLAMLPVEYARGNFWFYLTLREYTGEKIQIEHVTQAGVKLVPNASLYLFGKKKNYRLTCR
jgi:hypothetical protein